MATIKDVARLAGVGLGTASRAINGSGPVSPATLERVRKAIDELGFRPSHAARALLSGSSKMIGVYIPALSGTFFTPILQIIDTELRAAGLHMVVAFGVGLGNARRQALEGIEFLIERGCDGLIVMTSALDEGDLAVAGSRLSRLVALNHGFATIPDQCFTVDHMLGGRLAARTLLENGHRDIALLTGPMELEDSVARIDGFLAELAAAGIDTTAMWRREGDFSPAAGWAAARELVASGRKPTALFCANDEMAVGALSHFQEAGIRVPHDLSVLAYDDTPSAEYAAPRLTSVRMPWQQMTLNGINQLLNLCYDLKRPVERDFPVTVTLRASVAKLDR
ncbi:LacI family DNA-binding transcriptional regulator [Pseudoduganella albidiflava]|uniref:LacI family DNA-binding transcriptional regulator n=1 Tax=Pseudoduganella albidiflava TaxID=321983 RepID=A0A411X5Z0_9BURK|nr:LacI family DNA-binding transcriptional regulator [Pseudoduganella albidiflava]QBI04419.1 LacI family DNA-binding transcriptional regulator [Pseudoduganella albidiflava]GGY27092.1 LacI family transcriptional regulator [Pseudoduganella albidiflava]